MNRKFTALYSGVQFEYYVIVNALASFTSIFLLQLGFASKAVGMVLGIASLLSVVLQPILADLVDRSKKFVVSDFILWICMVMLAMCVWLLVDHTKSVLLLVVYTVALCSMYTVLPFITQLNYAYAKGGITMNYGLARSFGSIGFSVTAYVLGKLVSTSGITMVPLCSILAIVCLMATVFVLEKNYKKLGSNDVESANTTDEEITLKAFVKDHHDLIVLFIGASLLIMHLIVYCTYMFQFMEAIGGGAKEMGYAISLMAIVEVPMMMNYQRLENAFGTKRLLEVSLLGFLLKNVGFFVAKTPIVLIWMQVTQAIGFALFTPALISLIHANTRQMEQTKGQGVGQAVLTASGIFANLLGGYLIDQFGCHVTIVVCSCLTLVGAIVVFGALKQLQDHRES